MVAPKMRSQANALNDCPLRPILGYSARIGALVSMGMRRRMAARISAWRMSSGATPEAGKAEAIRDASRPALKTSSRLAPATAAWISRRIAGKSDMPRLPSGLAGEGKSSITIALMIVSLTCAATISTCIPTLFSMAKRHFRHLTVKYYTTTLSIFGPDGPMTANVPKPFNE